MQSSRFRSWLIEVKEKDSHQASDNISRVRRVEKAFSDIWQVEIDIDDEYERDKCEEILSKLSVSARKEFGKEINLPTNTIGISQLKTSLKNYVEFYESDYCER